MRTLYIECKMGVAGDMLFSSLLELLPNQNDFINKINKIGLPNVEIIRNSSIKCGIAGTSISVIINGEEELPNGNIHYHRNNHNHSDLNSITNIISSLSISNKVKNDVQNIYKLIAEAESHVHNKPVVDIHFHEIGAIDAICDIVGVCMLMEELAPENVIISPIHLGNGTVKCAHGILPVPAPATAYILRGIPIYTGQINSELCTPTGAALVKYFASSFQSMPVMNIEKIGYGMGKKDFEIANCVRTFIGETEESFSHSIIQPNNTVVCLSCNLDDITGEALSYAMEILLNNGALDVYFTPIQMKKNRPAYMLSCICNPKDANLMAKLMLKHTTTIGVRQEEFARYTLDRKQELINTKFGELQVKKSNGYGVSKIKIEFDDLVKVSKKFNITIEEILREINL